MNQCFPFSIKTCEQESGLDLSAGHRHLVFDAGQPFARPNIERRAAFGGLNDGTHRCQRIDDSPHWSAPERLIACQSAMKALPGEQSAKQTNGGTGVPEIYFSSGCLQSELPRP